MMPLLDPACVNVMVALPVLFSLTVTSTNGPPDTTELLRVKVQLLAVPTQSLSAMAAVAAKIANAKHRIKNFKRRIVIFLLGASSIPPARRRENADWTSAKLYLNPKSCQA
jgi:hypothetical protein